MPIASSQKLLDGRNHPDRGTVQRLGRIKGSRHGQLILVILTRRLNDHQHGYG